MTTRTARQTPSDEIDTIAYAVSFLEAAKAVAKSEEDWSDNAPLIVPFYALIGFSIENGLKAFLEFAKLEPKSSWSHSHNLTLLRNQAAQQGLDFEPEISDFVDGLSNPHREHQFRYPQKAETQRLELPGSALELTEKALVEIFLRIDGVNRVKPLP